MVHLFRSLVAGYAVATVAGGIALHGGAGPMVVFFGMWLGGSMLTVGFAAAFARYAGAPEALPVEAPVHAASGAMHGGLTARELAMWDADLAAEQFELDLVREDQAQDDPAQEGGRKAG